MYLYHAHAMALGGSVNRPVSQDIAARGSCSLSPAGGTSSAREGKFDNGLVSFDSAQTDLTGSVETQNGKTTYFTSASVAICGLNICNMIMADQIVLRIAGEHDQPPEPAKGKSSPQWGEARIITTGCHFDNLKIAGHRVTVNTDHSLYSDFPTHEGLQAEWRKGGRNKSRILENLQGRRLPKPPDTDPVHLCDVYRACNEVRKSAELKQTVLCSFVRSVTGISRTEIDNWGSIVRIPQFGTIYLGEVVVSPGHRCVHMFRLCLGSPIGGSVTGGTGSNGGTGIP